ncbi:LOB domain-containing protein 1-like [Tripterygium wilfordii]|uniref:LOB domain-containing protein 1-like n=1 Tax=Tripterygium wilfordii TaxID=458696 RepID=A0A7J7D8D6_TRIWF|nr:LOB domain-containing protein 1-like isoform X1 [Tripterygium wilfordii]KAF5742519.1 LOB domain-containing protein 1-like [Tripterygium wilfordii]
MDYSGKSAISPINVNSTFSKYSPSSSSSSPPSSQTSAPSFPSPSKSSPGVVPAALPSIVLSPCAACKILRRRCVDKCVLAPYFPPTEPYKFTIAHRVFGASNIIKFLHDLPESQRADAVSSMVYEASARIRDPVYGSAGAVFQLQKQLSELQEQLAKAQAELVNMQSQKANLVALFCMEMAQSGEATVLYQQQHQQQQQDYINTDPTCFYEDNNLLDPSWSPLWC